MQALHGNLKMRKRMHGEDGVRILVLWNSFSRQYKQQQAFLWLAIGFKAKMLECSCGPRPWGLIRKVKVSNSKQKGKQTSKDISSLVWHFVRIGFWFLVVGIEPGLYALALTIALSSDFFLCPCLMASRLLFKNIPVLFTNLKLMWFTGR